MVAGEWSSARRAPARAPRTERTCKAVIPEGQLEPM